MFHERWGGEAPSLNIRARAGKAAYCVGIRIWAISRSASVRTVRSPDTLEIRRSAGSIIRPCL